MTTPKEWEEMTDAGILRTCRRLGKEHWPGGQKAIAAALARRFPSEASPRVTPSSFGECMGFDISVRTPSGRSVRCTIPVN